ncbi:unnamed protein product [Closterium sp. NIES-65]|nr:unnamed protein product [Closterium sp. NIES-65]
MVEQQVRKLWEGHPELKGEEMGKEAVRGPEADVRSIPAEAACNQGQGDLWVARWEGPVRDPAKKQEEAARESKEEGAWECLTIGEGLEHTVGDAMSKKEQKAVKTVKGIKGETWEDESMEPATQVLTEPAGMRELFLGELSLLEMHKLAERLIGHFSFKLLLLLSLVDVLVVQPVWLLWFAAVTAIKMFGVVGKERSQRLSASPSAQPSSHLRTLALLLLVLLANLLLAVCLLPFFAPASPASSPSASRNVMSPWPRLSVGLLFAYEPLVIAIDTTQTLLHYCVHLLEAHSDLLAAHLPPALPLTSLLASCEWAELRSWLLFNVSFTADASSTLLTLAHCTLVLLIRGFSFSVIDLVLVFNIRTLLAALSKRVAGFLRWHAALRLLRSTFPDASPAQITAFADDCAICREPLSSAKRLPCGHLFHLSCLRSWLEHGSQAPYSCPTCRRPLDSLPPNVLSSLSPPPQPPPAAAAGVAANQPAQDAAWGGGGMRFRGGGSGRARHAGEEGAGNGAERRTGGGGAGGEAGVPVQPREGATAGGGREAGEEGRRGVAGGGGGEEVRGRRRGWGLWGGGGEGARGGGGEGARGGGGGWGMGMRMGVDEERMAAMVAQVEEVLPHVPSHAIRQELLRRPNVLLAVNALMDAW